MNNEKSAIPENLFNNHFFPKNYTYNIRIY